METKETKFVIAVVLKNPANSQKVLVVKRPPEDDSLPNVWGFPAVVVQNNELPEAAVERLGIEKLNTEIIASSNVGIMRADRGEYELILMDIEASLLGTEPNVWDASTANTKYVDQQWVTDYSILNEAASKGSLCSRIFLSSKGMSWE